MASLYCGTRRIRAVGPMYHHPIAGLALRFSGDGGPLVGG